jgi:electron transfer flavoprotein alpha subunit
MAVKINVPKCTGCGECVESCPSEALKVVGDKIAVTEDDCSECGACVDTCAQGALSLD